MVKNPEETKTWNLDDIVSLEDWPRLYDQTKTKIDELERFFDKFADPNMSDVDFDKLMQEYEQLVENLHRLDSRAYLMEAANNKDSMSMKFKNQMQNLTIYCVEKTQKIDLWLKGKEITGTQTLDDKNASRLFATVADLEYSLNYSRHQGKFSLSEQAEKISIAKDANGIAVLNNLREMIELELEFNLKFQNKEPIVTTNHAEVEAYMHSIDSSIRREAYTAFYKAYEKNIDKFFLIYQAIAKNWDHGAKIRGYAKPISMRNAANHVTDFTINTLLKVCSANREVYQRFFKHKAKLLGVDKLSMFDVMAPIAEDSSNNLDYNSMVGLVLDTFAEFDSNFSKNAQLIIDANHIDPYPRNNKNPGGFCLTVAPDILPYILMNFVGKSNDVRTMAHELGHGVHAILANKHSVSTQLATLPLSETASTFGEMIMFEKMIERAESVEQKRFLLADKLSTSFGAVMRQNYIVLFEIETHKKLQEGATEKEISDAWLKTLQDQVGESVDIDNMFRYGWARYPHIHNTPFYCYAYNFGELLSLALYKRYKDQGESFIPKFEQILSVGGSQSPEKVLADVGIDINSEQFWQDSFKIIEDWQDQLEQL